MANSGTPPAPVFWRLAIGIAVWLQLLGWGLSLISQLNAAGYAIGLTLGAAIAGILLGKERAARQPSFDSSAHPLDRAALFRRWRRFRKPLPLIFLSLLALAVLGGTLYAPNNIDALAYRTPRVLHWLEEQRWHWIVCPYNRLNTRSTGFEWITAPVFALIKTDRPLFLINVIAFSLLPGLTFSSLRSLGLGRKVAWAWMWLFPTGYCFAIQAGSIANDLYGTTLSVAAMAFGFRAHRTRSASDILYSTLAIALATGAKLSNLPLLLPWLIAVAPSLIHLLRPPITTAVVALFALLASFVPMAVLNQIHCGDWTGSSAEYAWTSPPDPISSATHNTFLLVFQNAFPPGIPMAGRLNLSIENLFPEFWKERLDGFAEGGRKAYALRELPEEVHAGLGFGLTWLLVIHVAKGMSRGSLRRIGFQPPKTIGFCTSFEKLTLPSAQQIPFKRLIHWDRWWWMALLVAPFASLAPYFMKSGILTAGRILAPYYPWLLGVVLIAAGRQLPLKAWWLRIGFAQGLLALGLVIALPGRNLWPAITLLEKWKPVLDGPTWERARNVYQIYAHRADAMEPIRRHLPDDVQNVGWVTGNDAEASLWKPYGSRRITHVSPVPWESMSVKERNAAKSFPRWWIVNVEVLENSVKDSLSSWAHRNGARIVHEESIRLLVKEEPQKFAILEFTEKNLQTFAP